MNQSIMTEWLPVLSLALPIALKGICGLIIIRGVFVWLSRVWGFYSPEHYHYWPRLPWRPVYRLCMDIRHWHERVFHLGKSGSTGGFAGSLALLCRLFKPGMVHLGRATLFGVGLLQPVGIHATRHLFMLAMTGTGKTTALVTIIATFRGSVFLIDPKAQIVKLLYAFDPRRWFILDPDGISGITSHSINFFDCIKEAMKRSGESAAVLWANRIAEAIIVTPGGSKTPYFFDVSRQFLTGLILHVLTHHPEEEHHLPFVRDLIVNGYRVYDDDGTELTKDNEAHLLLLQSMSNNPAFDGVIAGKVSAMQSAGGETGGNIRSTLQEQTKFLDLPNVRNILKHSDFSLAELKSRDDLIVTFTASIYSLREELSRLSRLLTNMTAYTFEAVQEKNGACLMIVDELPSQQYNATMEVILSVARSMGIVFLGVSQSIELMKKHYPNSWKSFIGESDATFWMGGNHPDNAAFLSQLLGKRMREFTDKRTGQRSRREISVMEPEQVARYLNPNSLRLIVTLAGGRAIQLLNEPFYKALSVWRYAPDPEHGDNIFRAITRTVFRIKPRHMPPTFPEPLVDDVTVALHPTDAKEGEHDNSPE
jgi:type IV secretory pathway TraG/TraD family ATPase VirD4